MPHFDGLTLDETTRFLQALGEGGFDIDLIREITVRPKLAEVAVKALRRRLSGEIRTRRTDVEWRPGDYVALDEGLTRIVAADPDPRRAKEMAIATGVSSPLVIPATQLRG